MLKPRMNTCLSTREHILSSEGHFNSSYRKQFPAPSLNIGCFFPASPKRAGPALCHSCVVRRVSGRFNIRLWKPNKNSLGRPSPAGANRPNRKRNMLYELNRNITFRTFNYKACSSPPPYTPHTDNRLTLHSLPSQKTISI